MKFGLNTITFYFYCPESSTCNYIDNQDMYFYDNTQTLIITFNGSINADNFYIDGLQAKHVEVNILHDAQLDDSDIYCPNNKFNDEIGCVINYDGGSTTENYIYAVNGIPTVKPCTVCTHRE